MIWTEIDILADTFRIFANLASCPWKIYGWLITERYNMNCLVVAGHALFEIYVEHATH